MACGRAFSSKRLFAKRSIWFRRLRVPPLLLWIFWDTVLVNRAVLFPLVKRWQRRRIPEIAERQAAGLEIFFR